MTFQPGDVVALKSGGQSMTVSGVSDDGIQCVWIGEEGELFRETLTTTVLKIAYDEDDEDDDSEETETGSDTDEDQEVRKIA